MRVPLQIPSTPVVAFLVVAFLAMAAVNAQTTESGMKSPAADNTKVNNVDRDGSTTTPLDQANDKESTKVTADIRKAVIADKSLSTSAHNVKIVTKDDTVTLRGPVASTTEKQRVESLAMKAANGKQVHSEISVSE